MMAIEDQRPLESTNNPESGRNEMGGCDCKDVRAKNVPKEPCTE